MNIDVFWSEKEVEILKENAGVQTIQGIARRLKRSPHAVRSKLNRLGHTSIRELNGSMSLTRLAEILDVSRCVIKRWIDDYGLPAHQRNYYYYSCKKVHYSIYPDEFWKWAENHRELINFRKIAPYSLLPEPEWLEEERRKNKMIPIKDQKNWTKDDDEKLLTLFYSGLKYKEIGLELGRSTRSVQSRMARIRKLGNKSPGGNNDD